MKIREVIVENDEEDLFGHSDRVGNDLRRVTYQQRIPSMVKMIHGGLEANAGFLVKQMAAELGRDADVFRRDPEIFDLANELISEIAAQVGDILMNLDPVKINDEDALNDALTDYAADIRSHCNLWYYIEEVLGEAGDDDGAYACAMTIEGEIGALLIKLIQHAYSQVSLSEAFDKPYKGKWEKSDYGDVDLNTKLPDGTNLNIMFNQEYDGEGEEVIQVDFHRNNSQDVTGEGDAQRIFATVLDAIQKYIKKYKPQRLTFSATKDPFTAQNIESRAKLYTRLVQRYAGAWGYQAQVDDEGDIVIYQLTRLKQGVAESVNDYLWHGSRHRNEVLVPRQANDTGGAEGSNKNAVYATPNAKVAIAMGLTTPGSDTGMFPNDPQMVLFKGKIRKGEMVYLHKVPKDLFINHNGREWYSKPDVKEITPLEIKEVPVNKHLDLIRQATPKDLELQKKYMKENFHDGKHPEDKGDSKRLGVPTKASISTLRKVAKQGGRKGQLAHWMANMKAGRAKKK